LEQKTAANDPKICRRDTLTSKYRVISHFTGGAWEQGQEGPDSFDDFLPKNRES
jgi:hypothetical protein